MVMVVIMPVMMVMSVVVMMMVVVILGHEAAHAGAERIAVGAIRDVGTGGRGALPFDVVVVGFLDGADFGFKTHHGGAVFT